jgi:hypothetical protein
MREITSSLLSVLQQGTRIVRAYWNWVVTFSFTAENGSVLLIVPRIGFPSVAQAVCGALGSFIRSLMIQVLNSQKLFGRTLHRSSLETTSGDGD